ncbi:MAG: glycosyl hydrolase, partial [Candidatus Eisenbacteria bacterium]
MEKYFHGRAMFGALAAAVMLAAGTTRAADDFKIDSDTFEGLRARSLGPGVMSGRIACIDGVSGERNSLWVGSAGGGVWLSKDGGVTFKPVFDKHAMSIGAIRVSTKDPKVVWVGSGETWARNSVGVGDGVYKTIDGGDSWIRMGLEHSERIASIVIHPEHPDTVLIAATGPLFGSGGERGVYRTRDGGRTWERVLFSNDDSGAADLCMDPQNPDVLYASLWQVRRQAWTFNSGGPGSGLYKSSDGGTTWKKLSQGLPDGPLGRIGVAVSPARASRVYAVIEAKRTAFYMSDDAGEHWTRMNDSNPNVTGRPFYFAGIVPDPRNFDRVYKGGTNLSVS